MKKLGLLCLLSLVSTQLFSQESLSKEDQAALAEVQKMLSDPKLRSAAINSSPDAIKTNQNVLELGKNKENTEAMYKISGEILGTLLKKYGNDPAKIQSILAEALKDPKSLYQHLDPSQVQQIKSVSSKIEAEQNKKP